MVGFSGILDTGRRSSDYEKRIVSRFKGKLVKMINGKWLMVNLMIIPFHLKLDKFYCIGVMN